MRFIQAPPGGGVNRVDGVPGGEVGADRLVAELAAFRASPDHCDGASHGWIGEKNGWGADPRRERVAGREGY